MTEQEYIESWKKETTQPYGFCWCGCGQKTNPAAADSEKFRTVRGALQRYVHNHHARKFFIPAFTFTQEWAKTEAGAWFMGMWVTDGYVSEKGSLCISLKDKDAIEKLIEATGIPGLTIKFHKKLEQWSLRFSLGDRAKDWVKLTGLPLGPKTSKEIVPAGLELNPNFWRGVVEGDGWINNSTVSIVSASFSFCQAFKHFVETIYPGAAVHHTDRYLEQRETRMPLRQTSVSGDAQIAVVAAFYFPPRFFCMERKRKSAFALGQHLADAFDKNYEREQMYLNAVKFYTEDKLSIYEIERQHGIRAHTVRNALKAAGLKVRSENRQSYKTHCKRGHEYNADNMILTSTGARRCLICKAENSRQRYTATKTSKAST